jgi:hypothetical protein
MVSNELRARYSGVIEVDESSRSLMRKSLGRLSLKRRPSPVPVVPVQRAKYLSDATCRDIGSTATVLARGKPLSFSSGNPMFSGHVDGPVQREIAVPLALPRGAKNPNSKAARSFKPSKSRKAGATKPLTTEFGSLARADNRPIVYAVPAWNMVMPPARAAKETAKAVTAGKRVKAQPEPELPVADSMEGSSVADEQPNYKGSKMSAPAVVRPQPKKGGSFTRFFRRGKKGKSKEKNKK